MAIRKEVWMSLFISAIMLFSVAGFALYGNLRGNEAQPDAPVISPIMDRPLTTEETLYLLRSGKVIVNDQHYADCLECREKVTEVEFFARQYSAYMVYSRSELPANETEKGYKKFEMVGGNGKIRGLQMENITEANLFRLLCELSGTQPRECILSEI